MSIYIQSNHNIIQRKKIHRDIKPDNILISFEGDAKLADFNVMKDIERTLASTEKGSPLYMAPEVATGDEKYSTQADIWSLCATFYHVFKGIGPYNDRTVRSSVQLALRKKDINNYKQLTEIECPHTTLRNIINFNLRASHDRRMTATQLINSLESENIQIPERSIESSRQTDFGRSSIDRTPDKSNYDDTILSVELDSLELQKINEMKNKKKFENKYFEVQDQRRPEEDKSYFANFNKNHKMTPAIANSDIVESQFERSVPDTVVIDSVQITTSQKLGISDTVDYKGVSIQDSDQIQNYRRNVNLRNYPSVESLEEEEDIPVELDFKDDDYEKTKEKASRIDKELSIFQSFDQQERQQTPQLGIDNAVESDKFMFESFPAPRYSATKKRTTNIHFEEDDNDSETELPNKCVPNPVQNESLAYTTSASHLMETFLSKTGDRNQPESKVQKNNFMGTSSSDSVEDVTPSLDLGEAKNRKGPSLEGTMFGKTKEANNGEFEEFEDWECDDDDERQKIDHFEDDDDYDDFF